MTKPPIRTRLLLLLGLLLLFSLPLPARSIGTEPASREQSVLVRESAADTVVHEGRSVDEQEHISQDDKVGGEKKEGAVGNGSSSTGMAEGILVAQILLLLLLGRVLGEAMQRIGQPALMGMLLSGIILGPSFFGWVWPEAQHFLFPDDEAQKGMIDGLSQVGILLLLMLTGMETDLKLVRRSGFAAVVIALCGIAFPFACGFLLGEYGPGAMFGGGEHGSNLATSLFLGTALSISSIKIVAMVVREMNFMRRNLGQLIVATAIMEDTAGWVIIAIIFGITGADGGGSGHPDTLKLAETVGGVALFLTFCLTLGRRIVFSAIRWANDTFRSDFPVITMILVIMCIFSLITQGLGVRTVLGAFMAGVLIGESPILTEHIENQMRGMITAFFMPVFFGLSGLSADLTILGDPKIALLTGLLVLIASVGKFSGAFVGAMLGKLKWREGIALGCAMNARGSTEVIVASIGLSMGALTQDLYTMIVTMAVLTTMAMPPMLRAALARLPMSKEEETRIEREAMDEKGFLPRLERLLLAADTSAVGRMAARIAGLLAGGQGMPVTILELATGTDPAEKIPAGSAQGEALDQVALDPVEQEEDKTKKLRDEPGKAGHAEQQGYTDSEHKEMLGAKSKVIKLKEHDADLLATEVKKGAEKSAAKLAADEAEPDPDKVHLTVRLPVDAPADVVKDEARKGYDLMFVALEGGVREDGSFSPAITKLSAGFAGPLIVFANAGDTVNQLNRHSRMLLPVNGTPQSRRGAEVAFALARATGAHVHALFVSQAEGRSSTRLREERELKEITELAARYNLSITTRIAPRMASSEAILKASKRNFTMVVMGLSARPGEELFFGSTATNVLKNLNKPILFLAS